MIRAVVFDLGHTIWDIGPHPAALDAAYAAMRAALAERLGRDDLPSATAFRDAVRDVLVEASETYFASDGTYATHRLVVEQPPSTRWVDEGCRKLGVELEPGLLAEITPPLFATEGEALIVGDGTLEALHDLDASGYGLGCITNTLADTASIRAMLRRHDIEQLMRSVVVSADEGYRKPHRSLFEKSLRELRVQPHEAAFVGDSPVHDIAGAKAAGMYAILTQQYATRLYADATRQPDAVIHRLGELKSLLSSLP